MSLPLADIVRHIRNCLVLDGGVSAMHDDAVPTIFNDDSLTNRVTNEAGADVAPEVFRMPEQLFRVNVE